MRGSQAGTSEETIAISAEEEQLLLDGAAPVGSPASDTSTVARHLASLQVTTPPREAPEDGDTSK